MTQATYVLFVAYFYLETVLGLKIPGSVTSINKGPSSCGLTSLPPRGLYPHRAFDPFRVKNRSMEEASLSCSDVSFYGAAVPKIPARVISQVAELKGNITSKIYNYNFQGTMYKPSIIWDKRNWIETFAKKHFTENDFILFTDQVGKQQVPLGPYDHSKEDDGWRPKDHESDYMLDATLGDHFDPGYWRRMIQSNFTLAPGGDHPWSMRFYEAILAGSIPVINAIETDLNDNDIGFWFSHVGYTYFTKDQVVNHNFSSGELKEMANENFELVVKYQTWLKGDNIPPTYCAFSGLCHSSSYCMRECELLTQA
jgi:hypothetical protein